MQKSHKIYWQDLLFLVLCQDLVVMKRGVENTLATQQEANRKRLSAYSKKLTPYYQICPRDFTEKKKNAAAKISACSLNMHSLNGIHGDMKA